jgi:hypothetical protein
MKNIKILLALTLSLQVTNSSASIFTPFAKISSKMTGKTKKVTPEVAIKQFTRGKTQNNPLENLIVLANDGEVRDAQRLYSIEDKLIESDLRNMDVVETLEEYLPNQTRQRNNYIAKKLNSAIQLHVHNHLMLKEMSEGDRSSYITVHSDNVKTLLIHIQLKISGMSGSSRDVDEFASHLKALRQIHFDLNNL